MPKAKSTTKPAKTAKTATKAKTNKASADQQAKEKLSVSNTPEAITRETAEEVVNQVANAEETTLESTEKTSAEAPNESEENATESAEESASEEKPSWELVVARMSPEFIARTWDFLVRTAPTREVWALLSKIEHAPVKMRITKGFQRTANSLRLPVVRHRLHDELSQNVELTAKILAIWSGVSPPPPSTAAASEFGADDNLLDRLPELTQRFGHEAVLLSLLALQRYQAITMWSEKVAGGEWTLEAPEAQNESENVVEAAEKPNNDKELMAARAENKKLLQRLEKSEQKMREAQSLLASSKDNFARETHELHARLKQEENRFVREHEKLAEDERLLDRTTRKLKSAEKQVEELEADSKKLKKQVRHQQEVSEELQKEIAGLKALIVEIEDKLKNAPLPIEEASQPVAPSRKTALDSYMRAPEGPLPAVMVPASRTVSSSPLDQVFQWNADGRVIRVTTREIKRGIDANNEGWVFALIQALDALRHASPEGYRLLMERVKELDTYYFRVLTVRTTRILVDASNVARYERNRFGKGQIRFLLAMRDELRRRNCFPIRFVADASLPYNLDSPEELTAMERRGELELTAAGQEADEILAREARRTGAFVVTNDRTFHTKTSPHFEPPRLSFHFYEQHLVMDDF